jgi:hypothetical protein
MKHHIKRICIKGLCFFSPTLIDTMRLKPHGICLIDSKGAYKKY